MHSAARVSVVVGGAEPFLPFDLVARAVPMALVGAEVCLLRALRDADGDAFLRLFMSGWRGEGQLCSCNEVYRLAASVLELRLKKVDAGPLNSLRSILSVRDRLPPCGLGLRRVQSMHQFGFMARKSTSGHQLVE